ncbi:unnamed protein product [Allacma fusca]|uniref:SAND domain-containing protein n=1 Tax=Allacma fusca TaxID=39272 RepID=A0A8J2NMQ2_9HEXA|nr:unnamed protein product [Allacma fusca]
MLPETSLLPLLQPPSIEFINNQFQSEPNQSDPLPSGQCDSLNPDVIIQVECGHNIGYMNLSKLCQGSKGSCIFYNGLYLTPNEFQFVSGRETAKDWKRSIRHNGKSLKLLIKRKLINVHSNSCECFQTNKVTPMEDSTSTSNDEECSGKSSPVESLKLTSIINRIKSSLKGKYS